MTSYSQLVPVFSVPGTTYTIQFRRLLTSSDQLAAKQRNFALCLWYKGGDNLYEIAAISDFVAPETLLDEAPNDQDLAEVFERALDVLTRTQEEWSARNKSDQRELRPAHVRWLADEAMVEAFREGMARLIDPTVPLGEPVELVASA